MSNVPYYCRYICAGCPEGINPDTCPVYTDSEKEPAMTTTSNTIETKEIEMTHEEEQKAWNETERRYEKKPLTEEQKANRRFWNFLEMVYKLARMSGLYIEGHIKVRDKRTGKVWE